MPRITITVPDINPQPYRFQLDRQVVTMGRGSENDIAIESGSVSVKHAEMCRIEGGYELRDVGSTNGIKVDGERHEVLFLRHGSTLKLGDVAFDFQLSDEEREALAREKPPHESPIIKEPEEANAKRAPRDEYRTSQRGGFGMTLLFLILAAAAFFTGLAIRHQKDTGGSLIEGMKAKFSDPKKSPTGN